MPKPLPTILLTGMLAGLFSLPAHAQDARQSIYDEKAPDGFNFVGERVGKHLVFRIVRRGKHQANICVYINGRKRYTMPDEPVVRRDNQAAPFSFHSGESSNGYSFFLEAHQHWLFVIRHCFRRLDVAYLYRRNGPHTMTVVRPRGLRFEEAALIAYAQIKHLNAYILRGGEQAIDFVKWQSSHTLIVCIYAESVWTDSPDPPKGELHMDAYMSYDLRTHRFRIIPPPSGYG